MKNNLTLQFALLAPLALAACGKYQKNPVQGLNKLRENARQEIVKGPEKAQIVTKEIVVEKPVLVVKEQATLDDKYLVISPDPAMTFIEGERASFLVRARALAPGLKIRLTAQGLPEGAVIQPAALEGDPDAYSITWTAPLYTVPMNSAVKALKIKLIAQVTEVPAGVDRKTIEGLVKEKEAALFVVRNQAAPTDVVIEGLPGVVQEGTITRFSVTVLVPGIDEKTPIRPKLVVSYDGISVSAGNPDLELDGTRHLITDSTKKDAEYLGGGKWRFNLVFDTKNISVQPAMTVAGDVNTKAEASRVRLSFKIYSPSGSAAPEVLKQIKIGFAMPAAAPRFDFSGLGKEALSLSPGSRVKLSFFAASADSSALVRIEMPDLKSLPGSPRLTCANPVSAKAECSIEWEIPCSVKAADLSQEIPLTATAVINGRNTAPTQQVLKTVAQAPAALCAEEEKK